ncbi:MAG: hypothetical protein KDD76_01715 [Rickettsiales bacterium]|nr:hypothetical protein [Rickettsiales bacterium]
MAGVILSSSVMAVGQNLSPQQKQALDHYYAYYGTYPAGYEHVTPPRQQMVNHQPRKPVAGGRADNVPYYGGREQAETADSDIMHLDF